MKKCLFWLASCCFLLIACQTTPEPPRGLGGGLTRPAEPISPSIQLSVPTGQPNQVIKLSGENFPDGEVINIRLGTAADVTQQTVLLQATASAGGEFVAELMLPTLWPPAGDTIAEKVELTIQAATGDPALKPATATITLDVGQTFTPYHNPTGGFTLNLPAHWELTEPQQTALGEMVLAGIPPLTSGNPAVSTFLVTDLTTLTPFQAAELLTCGQPCPTPLQLTKETFNGLAVRSLAVKSEGAPTLTWYFVENGSKLLFFTLNDPQTLQSLRPLIHTLTLEPLATAEVSALSPSPTPEPTATAVLVQPTNTPIPTAEPTPVPTPAGPLQVVMSFMEGLSTQTFHDELYNTLTAGLREQLRTAGSFEALFLLNERFVGFAAVREETADGSVIIRVQFTLVSGAKHDRLITMEKQEDGRWFLAGVSLPPELQPTPITEEATPTP